MMHDPIVDEVRAIRDAIAKEHDYDIDAIFEAFRHLEEISGRTHVAPARKPKESGEPGSIDDTAQQAIAAVGAARLR